MAPATWFETSEILVVDEDASGNSLLGASDEPAAPPASYCCAWVRADDRPAGTVEGRLRPSRCGNFGEVQTPRCFARPGGLVTLGLCGVNSRAMLGLYDVIPVVTWRWARDHAHAFEAHCLF